MQALSDKIVGKIFKALDRQGDICSIHFSDGSAMTVYTAIECKVVCESELPSITNIIEHDDKLEIRLGAISHINILMSDEFISSPEIFVFRDIDGMEIVKSV